MNDDKWHRISDETEVPSPSLLIYRDRVERNLAQMLRIAGDPDRLRPHIKTHKIPQLMQLQLDRGIEKYKCATIAEAEMAAASGAPDVLVACQQVGPNARRLALLARSFTNTQFSTIFDDVDSSAAISSFTAASGVIIGAWVDLDVGQHRTGIAPGPNAVALAKRLINLPGLRFEGIHAYDGHLTITDVAERKRLCDAAYSLVESFRAALELEGIAVPTVVVGGSPTFPIHALREGVELSPGTTVFWDAGYATKIPDLPFQPAACLLTRVTSKPAPGRLCLDLGHKAVASEMPHPRVVFPELPDATVVMHSEEHLVIETERAADFRVGDALYGIPWHVCPTVALHQEIRLVENGKTTESWVVTARSRRLSI
jgi:D-serine deaminase-like pyridoxal phosphate-dependent protein